MNYLDKININPNKRS